jgi:hypothetical protein
VGGRFNVCGKCYVVARGAYWKYTRVTAQLIGPRVGSGEDERVFGDGWNQFASFTRQDLLTIAPWMKESVTRFVDGFGLGI